MKNKINPIKGFEQITFIKNQITRSNIIVGDYTYYDDNTNKKFEDCVTHHYDFTGDKLIIGKYCQIAKGIEFIMNGANHQLNSVSTYPFFIFGFGEAKFDPKLMPYKGDTVVGNDVWFGQNTTIMPGVTVGNGVIIAANSVVVSDLESYCIYGGNPAKLIKRRFTPEITKLLEELKWWEYDEKVIANNIHILTDPTIENIKNFKEN